MLFFFLLSPDGISNHIQWLTIKPFILVFVVVLDFLCMNMADSSSKTETWGGRGEGAGRGLGGRNVRYTGRMEKQFESKVKTM